MMARVSAKKIRVQCWSMGGVPWSMLNYRLAEGSALALYTVEEILLKDGWIILTRITRIPL